MEDRAKKITDLIRRVRIEYINQDKPLIIFEINGRERVTFNEKGWICDHVESDEKYEKRVKTAIRLGHPEPPRWTCSYRPDQDCYHILACKELVRRLGELKEQKENTKLGN